MCGLLLLNLMVVNKGVASYTSQFLEKVNFVPRVIRTQIQKLLTASSKYRELSKRKHGDIFLISAINDLLGIVVFYAFATALGLNLSFVTVGWIRCVIAVLTMLPVSFLGLGIRESGLILILQPYGIEPADAVAFSFLVLAGHVWLAFIGGLLEAKNFFVLQAKEA